MRRNKRGTVLKEKGSYLYLVLKYITLIFLWTRGVVFHGQLFIGQRLVYHKHAVFNQSCPVLPVG